MNPKSLCLIGASCRAAAQAAKRAGMDTIYAWDEFLDADLIEIAQSQPLSELGIASLPGNPTRQIPLVLCGGIENRPDLLEPWIEQGFRCGVTVESLRQLRSLDSLEDWAKQSGIYWPETLKLPPGIPWNQSLDTLVNTQAWLIKPLHKAGGIHIHRVPGTDQDRDFSKGEFSQDEWFLQKEITGTSIGVTYCSDSQETSLVGIAQGIPAAAMDAPLPFIYSGNIAPFPLAAKAISKLKKFGEIVASQTSVKGLWQADFQIDSQEELWLLEINPRWSASMELHEILQGVSWMKRHLSILDATSTQEEPSPAEILSNNASHQTSFEVIGKGIVYALKDLSVKPEQLEQLWQARWRGSRSELNEFSFRMLDIPQAPRIDASIRETFLPAGSPIATVLCVGDTPEQVFKRLGLARQTVLKWVETI